MSTRRGEAFSTKRPTFWYGLSVTFVVLNASKQALLKAPESRCPCHSCTRCDNPYQKLSLLGRIPSDHISNAACGMLSRLSEPPA